MRPARLLRTAAMLGALAILPGHAAAQSGGNPAQERLPALVRLTAGGVPALERDAEQGKPEAMAMLGEAYGFGFGNLPVDGGKAAGWLGRAGQAGVPGARARPPFSPSASGMRRLSPLARWRWKTAAALSPGRPPSTLTGTGSPNGTILTPCWRGSAALA